MTYTHAERRRLTDRTAKLTGQVYCAQGAHWASLDGAKKVRKGRLLVWCCRAHLAFVVEAK